MIADLASSFWPHFAALVTVLAMVWTAVHIIMKKRDTRAATGWLGLVWFAPLLGVCLYWLFGINRIQRKARRKWADKEEVPFPESNFQVDADAVQAVLRRATGGNGLLELCRLSAKVTGRPLLEGNRIKPLCNGDTAYPQMLAAIKRARRSVALSSYIFDNDAWGRKFQAALKAALDRGVEVRVLVDAVGARYSFPSIIGRLRRDGIPVTAFMKTRLPWRFGYANLRNHRKILIIDGQTAFSGGMNIRAASVLSDKPARPVQDIHFQIQGPVVAEVQQIFAEDWCFCTREKLQGPAWFPFVDRSGKVLARAIPDGPDEDFNKLMFVMLGAITTAKSSIRIATPYFLPDNELLIALRVAALRGVEVEILLPGTPNLRLVKWASDALLEELLQSGCRIFYSRPPFDHSKLMVVDGAWVLLGSANWDARSLALNFEFNVECYDVDLARQVEDIISGKRHQARRIDLAELRAAGWPVRLRNRLIRLFSPYL
ncbi:MAG: cardiolipin synthase [Desulfobulbaceae bacterium]|nr:MAG: cardiolipin synthase [Desulfobulbaceae bacterium]